MRAHAVEPTKGSVEQPADDRRARPDVGDEGLPVQGDERPLKAHEPRGPVKSSRGVVIRLKHGYLTAPAGLERALVP